MGQENCEVQQTQESAVGPCGDEGQPHSRLLHWVCLEQLTLFTAALMVLYFRFVAKPVLVTLIS